MGSPKGFHVLREGFNPNNPDFPRNLSKTLTMDRGFEQTQESNMTQDTIISLAVGGVIGFLFSFLTNLINFRFQLQRDKEAKKWELEKREHEEGEKIIMHDWQP